MPNAPRRLGANANGRTIERRGNSHSRGYDYRWTKLRAWWAKEHPLCQDCEDEGLTVLMDEVDHVIPFNGKHDPLRLDATNLRSLCKRHHRLKTIHG